MSKKLKKKKNNVFSKNTTLARKVRNFTPQYSALSNVLVKRFLALRVSFSV